VFIFYKNYIQNGFLVQKPVNMKSHIVDELSAEKLEEFSSILIIRK